MRLASAALAFWAAFLLFLIQPAAGKRLLASYGGAPAVWTSVLVFFQVAVVAGYALAIPLARMRRPLLAALATSLLAGAGWIAHQGSPLAESPVSRSWPVMEIALELSLKLGFAIVAIATTSTLLQEWLARRGGDPSWLYAASNAGSLAGLAAYPALVEPLLAIRQQGEWWQWAVGAWAVLMPALAWGAPAIRETMPPASAKAPGSARIAEWMLLGAVPCFFLMAATRHLVTDVAPVPLLGLSPLALYLVAYILSFAKPGWRVPETAGPMAGLALALMASMGATDSRLGGAGIVVLLHLTGYLFALWSALSGQSSSRPAPSGLPAFYLATAVGGALGGMAQAALAPVIFRFVGDWDYPLGLAALMLAGPRGWRWPSGRDLLLALGVGACAAALAALCPFAPGPARELAALGLPLASAYALAGRSAAWGPCLAAIFIASGIASKASTQVVYLERGFFGTTRVARESSPAGPVLKIYHGTTVHGIAAASRVDTDGRALPLAYYHPRGPAGATLGRLFPEGAPSARVAVVGLGAGSLAWYGRREDEWDFYEIDPVVIRVAAESGLFRYLADCRARWTVIAGDGRERLRNHAGAAYDLIVIDAFSSDSIPSHLLTVEAIDLYRRLLAPGGAILLHVSNRYLDLGPVAAAGAIAIGLSAWEWADLAPETDGINFGRLPSEWVALSEAENWRPGRRGGWSRMRPPETVRPWTDDHSSVLSAWRTRRED